MKRDTSKLEKHLKDNPTDANSVIALLKIRSDNYIHNFDLERKKKLEFSKSLRRKRAKNEKMQMEKRKG